jgi:hypothetical protein
MSTKAPQKLHRPDKQSKLIKPIKSLPVKKPPAKPKATAGGSRPGAGRPAGAVSVEKKALRELAGVHTDAAVAALAALFKDPAQGGMVRVAAANSILDRAHGRPNQSVDLELNDVTGFSPDEKADLERSYAEAKLNGVWVKQKESMQARKRALNGDKAK